MSFQEGPPTEIGSSQGASGSAKPTPPSKPSKWQPLTTVEPSPVGEHDPFSLGDSEDEKDTKAKDQSTTSEAVQSKRATVEDDSNKGEAGKS